MFKQRLITALVLVPLVVAAILWLPTHYLSLAFAAAVLAAAWEWTRLSELHNLVVRGLYLGLVAAAMAVVWRVIDLAPLMDILLWCALVWWGVGFVWMLSFPRGAARSGLGQLAKAGAGFLVLVPAWASLTALHATPTHGPYLVLFLMVLIWVADSGAYVAGKRWGKNKLAPKVSPGKTWQGVYGELFTSALLGLLGGWLFGLAGAGMGLFVLLCLATTVLSVIGDLFESMAKRHVGLKDSGQLLPGHGGMLDRIDSLTAAAPLFLLGVRWLWGAA